MTDTADKKDSPSVRRKKAQAQRLRAAILKSGGTEAQVQAALAVFSGPKYAKIRVTGALRRRIVELLAAPGDKCILIRNQKGVRAFPEASIKAFQEHANRVKPWLKKKGAKPAEKPA